MSTKSEAVGEVIALAGGKIVGKTRLQKSVFILELSGLGYDFPFSYHHYGPYSEELAWATKDATVEKTVVEKEDHARWGGVYSIFISTHNALEFPQDEMNAMRASLLARAVSADAVVLELAATAALLKIEGFEDCWSETARRKPLKANADTIGEAQKLWDGLRTLKVPNELPALN